MPETTGLFSIDPSTNSNTIDGARLPNTVADFCIRTGDKNGTFALTIKITRDKGNTDTITLASKFVLMIKNSKLNLLTFTDTTSYNIQITRRIITFMPSENNALELPDEEIYFLE